MTLSTAEENALTAFFKTKRGNKTLRPTIVVKLVEFLTDRDTPLRELTKDAPAPDRHASVK